MMMIVSGCGVGFNVILALVLHGCASDIAHHHSHGGAACSHSHSHAGTSRGWRLFRRARDQKPTNGALVNGDYTMKDLASVEASVVGSEPRNINLRAALIHVIGDLIQSCGVLLASILIKFYPEAKVVDPICTFVFSFLVLLTSARVVRDALNMLMQAVPPNFSLKHTRHACAVALCVGCSPLTRPDISPRSPRRTQVLRPQRKMLPETDWIDDIQPANS
ncbi:hypothetical protein B5X24_HaOG216310, partial [Helicoverpa armigera]